ncbi:MAG: metallophosphoesterase, partial [Planctomycetaceae bacterium]|nr:metallophosphoesterase [Planctomycetaceae bacterium]
MRILVVSDIHGNWPALAAIDEPHDICLCLGDLVDYGPDPAACVRWAMT